MRTIEQIDKEIKHAEEHKTISGQLAREETDKDIRQGYYLTIDRCNEIINSLVNEKRKQRHP